MALQDGTFVVADQALIQAVDYALTLKYHEEPGMQGRRRRSSVNDAGLGVTAEDYHGAFMCEILGPGIVYVYDSDNPQNHIAGYTISGKAFGRRVISLTSYGRYYVWALLAGPMSEQYFYVFPVDYPIINQYHRHYVLIAEVNHTENGTSVTQIFKGHVIDDSQHHYVSQVPDFQLVGSVSGSTGNYQIALTVRYGVIYHSSTNASSLEEYVATQNIDAPASDVNVYLLYKRSSSGGARFIVAKSCVLNDPKEYILQSIGTIVKNQYGGYNLVNDWVGGIRDTVTRTATFNAYRVSTITETSSSTGIVLTETVTGWEVTSGYIIAGGGLHLLSSISGEFPSSGTAGKFATLTYNPSTRQYSTEWTDHAPSQQDIYTWGKWAFTISSNKTITWVMNASYFVSGDIVVRDRWQ